MGRLIIVLALGLALCGFQGCGDAHEDMQIKFSIRNSTDENIQWNSFNLDGSGFSGIVIIAANENYFTGGGGILDVDSVIFIKVSNSDTLIYRNARHGDNISTPNHFFNINNWVEEDTNKFFYYVKPEDFDN